MRPTPSPARGPQRSLLPARPGQALPTALQQPSSRHMAQTSFPAHKAITSLKGPSLLPALRKRWPGVVEQRV